MGIEPFPQCRGLAGLQSSPSASVMLSRVDLGLLSLGPVLLGNGRSTVRAISRVFRAQCFR